MSHRETTDPQRMEQLILAAVRRIAADADLKRFLAWARTAIPEYLGLEDDLSADEAARLCTLLGIALWNATPRPELGYRLDPLPTPTTLGPCPCGSGARYRDCCEPYGPLPELPPELVWELMLGELPEAGIQEALRQGAVPEVLYGRVAERWLDQDRPGRAVALLEPLFTAGQLAARDARFELALDLLCDAYDALDHWKKKQALLLRVTEDGERALKAAAWQRFGTMFIDDGDFEYAREAFIQAQREAPDSPGTALLELTLLAAQHQDDHARARARFWLQRFRRGGDADPRLLDFLALAAEDPQGALIATQIDTLDPPLLLLRDWVAALAARAPQPYRIEPLPNPDAAPADGQLALFPPELLPPAPEHAGAGAVGALLAPPALRALEAGWRRLFPSGKPYGTLLGPADEGAAWADDDWIAFLIAHPEAADSLDVLDDLATVLAERPELGLPWFARALLVPLLARAERIIEATAAHTGVDRLPWADERNRPALRLLVRAWRWHADAGDDTGAGLRMERLLALNPRDNHGVRAALMNHYLRGHQDELALDLARRFPTDSLADLAYGEVLALYRLGRQETAAQALRAAVGRLPRIPGYLLRKRVKRPALMAGGPRPGGDDQAWRYREAMRDVWEAEPGLLAWMRKLTA